MRPVRKDDSVFAKALLNPYNPETNKDGYLIMLVAENKLMWKDVAEKLQNLTQIQPEWVFSYGSMTGNLRLKQALAKVMERWIFPKMYDEDKKRQQQHGRSPFVDPDFIRVQAGVGSVLTQLSYLLGDPGDSVLTLGPIYPAFPEMMRVYGQLVLRVITPAAAASDGLPSLPDLNEGYDRAVAEGHPPRILLICQPHNPTGIIYSKETMRNLIEWALEKGLHVISDEIYALSVFPGKRTVSAAEILWEIHPDWKDDRYLGDFVHVVAGVSKDWAMSGFRMGWVFSHNPGVLQGMDCLGSYQSPSQYTQSALIDLFEDDVWIDSYLQQYSTRLHETYEALREALALVDIPICVTPQGGLFVWADASGYLQEGQTEQELWEELGREARVLFTTGESCHGRKPGLFRMVYGWPEGGPEAMRELGRRLVQWKANRNCHRKDN